MDVGIPFSSLIPSLSELQYHCSKCKILSLHGCHVRITRELYKGCLCASCMQQPVFFCRLYAANKASVGGGVVAAIHRDYDLT